MLFNYSSMNQYLRMAVMFIGLGLFLSSVSVNDAIAQNILGDILHRMDVHNKALQSLQAEVTMAKYNSQLGGEPDITFGSTSYLLKGKRYVRIDWIKPVEEHISVIGDDYELWRPRLNQVMWGKADKAKNNASAGGALSFMNMSKAELTANYSVVYIGREKISGGAETSHIQLAPKVAANYKLAELWVDDNGMPRQARITEQNNDTTAILLTNIQKNVTLNAKIFTLEYDPKKVKRVP
jgi:outer membrane lipoprotein-sorting protein